jgi:hypothetical protein
MTATYARQGARERAFHVLHHMLAAATLATAVLALEHLRLLDWLDAAMLRMVAPVISDNNGAELPQLVLIDATAYADRFALRSPLDSAQLTTVVADLLAAHPVTLLVDLQLEPALGEPEVRPLDRLLQAASHDPAGATRIVLPVPESRTPTVDRAALAWMRSLCESGVTFGSAQLLSHFGAVIRIDDDPRTLAALARATPRAQPGVREPHAPATSGTDARANGVACGLAANAPDLGTVLTLMSASDANEQRTEPMSPGALKGVVDAAIAWRPDATRVALSAHPPRVLVLGGDYDERDRFVTSAGNTPVPGVAVHAAAIASHGRIQTSHVRAWLFDVAVGTLLGMLFTALWTGVARFSPLPPQPEPKRQGLLWFALKAWGQLSLATCVWAVALLIGWAFMAGSGILLKHGLWMNPGPVVLGMFLHALLLKDDRQGHEAAHADNAHENRMTWTDFTLHAPAWPLQVLLVIGAILWFMLRDD